LSVGETFPARTLRHVDKYLLDNGQGGSGQRFDWAACSCTVMKTRPISTRCATPSRTTSASGKR
ncbi:hypothetical protein CJ430_17260, partial [Klebsiella pneumoniae]